MKVIEYIGFVQVFCTSLYSAMLIAYADLHESKLRPNWGVGDVW